jgi:histidinol-phosphate aminotransferase
MTRTCLIQLASNENPFGPSPKALEAMQAALSQANRYPDDNARLVQTRLAEHHSLDSEQVLVGAGSTHLIGIIARALLRRGLNAITSELSFIAYPMATRTAGGELIQVAMRDNGFDLDSVAAAITPATSIIFLANPNNPTGTAFEASKTDEFVARMPETTTVVLDEAYYEYAEYFAAQRGIRYSHSLNYVRDKRNVVVLRTFSKVHGLAGVRIGYALGRPELLRRLAQIRSTYSVSIPAQAAAVAALEDEEHVQKSLLNNSAEAQRLTAELRKLGYEVLTTWANFLYCDIGKQAEAFVIQMKEQGVLIRGLAAWGAPTAIRISIGTPEENTAFLEACNALVR